MLKVVEHLKTYPSLRFLMGTAGFICQTMKLVLQGNHSVSQGFKRNLLKKMDIGIQHKYAVQGVP